MATEFETADTAPGSSESDSVRLSARNYFFLVAALIALVCLSVALVLAYGSEGMTAGQVWFLSGFLVLFSVFSVSIVGWMAIRQARHLAFAERDGAIDWRTTSPEKQKRRLNLEVRELGAILKLNESQLADLRAAYIVAEDLALRRVQNESRIPLMRKVTLGAADFDAVLIEGDLVICVSMIFLVRPSIPQEKINRLLREAAIARNALEEFREGSRIRLLLLLVTQLDQKDEARLRSTVADLFKATPVNVDIRWMDFQKLQGLYSDE
ncbi:MAG: hypothetical protein IPM63_16675 [Acidobacteriota bacterium]|nr:MAG: hypothetical protein IPM63_16675 [Acidobacteriota bacterium]